MKTAMDILREGTVIPAMPLALDDAGNFYEKGQRALIRYYAAAGVGGLAVGVHTTQFAIRDPRYALFEPVLKLAADELTARERALGRPIVKIAGACGPLKAAVAEAEMAAALGYDAVLLSPGGLSGHSEAEMLDRTRAVAEVLPVVGFYLQPSVGGRVFSFDYWKTLAEIPGVAAIKAAPFNRYQTLDVARAVALSSRRDEITLYTGNDDNILVDLLTPYRFTQNGQTYEKRFRGGLLGHWAVWTRQAALLLERVKALPEGTDIPAELLTLAVQITDANAAFFDTANGFKGCIAGIHEVLKRQGLMVSTRCLDPDETLSPGQSEEIDRVYAMYPHLCDDSFVREHLSEFWA